MDTIPTWYFLLLKINAQETKSVRLTVAVLLSYVIVSFFIEITETHTWTS